MLCRTLLFAVLMILLSACRIDIIVPAGGAVSSESGAYSCAANSTCAVAVADSRFNETFAAIPAQGFQFIGWKKGLALLCGGSLSPCPIDTSWFVQYDDMMNLLRSDGVVYVEPVFIPLDHIRRYQAGDVVEYVGTVESWRKDEPEWRASVSVRQEYLPGKYSHLDKTVLTRNTTVTFSDSGEKQSTEQSMWQEDNGALFDLDDDYGNAYVSASGFEKGLASIPVPLIPLSERRFDFYTLAGGPVSGPVTQGHRSIVVSSVESIPLAIGEYEVYPVTQRDSYEFLFTYAENQRGSTVVIDRDMWISPAKGLVKTVETRRVYSRPGVLQSETRWELAACKLNY